MQPFEFEALYTEKLISKNFLTKSMIIKTIKVSEKGQIAIPREIRHLLNIDQGDELIIVQNDEKILIEKSKKLSQQIEDDFSDITQLSEMSLKEVWDNKEDDVWNEYLKNDKKKR